MKAILRAGALRVTALLAAVAAAVGACTNLLGSFDLVCDAPCGAPTDCPDPMNPCVERTCTNGCCGTVDLPDTTAVTPQPTGTCQRLACDGMGNVQALADDTKPPAGIDDCHSGGCLAGTPEQSNKTGGTPCSSDGGAVCGSTAGPVAGTCVACNVTADCASGTVCLANACVPMSCMDTMKDGTETDVDCGGGTCPGCATGKVCVVATDCHAGVCTAGVCAAPSCTDGVHNGTETDVDCGGGCPACAYAKRCAAPTDCASTFCEMDRCGAEVLASGQIGARGVAVDAQAGATLHSVYWTDDNSLGSVHRALVDGTSPVTLFSNQPSPTGVAVATTPLDGAYLVWTDGALTTGTVQQATIGTAATPAFTPLAAMLAVPGALVADSSKAYWLTSNAVMQAPVGTAATGANAVVREAMVTSPSGIARDGVGEVYWTSGVPSTGSVHMLPSGTGTGTSTVLAGNQDNPGAIVVQTLILYWCNNVANGSVMKMPVSTPNMPTPVATGENKPISIAVDATYVYWATSGDGAVKKAAIDGTGATVVMVTGETSIAAIAIDGSYVYWTNPFDGTVKRVHK